VNYDDIRLERPALFPAKLAGILRAIAMGEEVIRAAKNGIGKQKRG
jgi:hypothetical protein